MLIIIHRVNTIEELKKIPRKYGVEIDVRSCGKELLLSHEPIDKYKKYERLEGYLKEFRHAFIIFDIKEAGIENKVIELVKRYKIKNYFLLDVEFYYIYCATRKRGFRNIAIRFSEAEPIEMALAQKGFLDWVWVDVITCLPLDKEKYKKLKEGEFKLCLVCPERWGRPGDIGKYIDYMRKNDIKIDAVMTSLDCAKKWEEF